MVKNWINELITLTGEHHDAEVVLYGLVSLFDGILSIFVLLLIGFCLDKLGMTVLYLIFAYCVAGKLGGYHAETRLGCMAVTILLYLFAMYLPGLLGNRVNVFILFLSCALSFWAVWIMAPVMHPNKPLEKDIYRRNRQHSRILIFIIIGMVIIFHYIEDRIACILFVNMLEVVISMIIGKEVNRGYEKRNGKRHS